MRPGKVEFQNMDTILTSQKETLKRCKSIVDCPYCESPSNYVLLLLVVVCRKLVEVMEEAVRIFVQWKIAAQQAQDNPITDGGDAHCNQAHWSLSFGNYTVDSETEWAQVIKALLVLHLKGILGILESLKRIARMSLRETELVMVQKIEHIATEAVLNLQSSALGD